MRQPSFGRIFPSLLALMLPLNATAQPLAAPDAAPPGARALPDAVLPTIDFIFQPDRLKAIYEEAEAKLLAAVEAIVALPVEQRNFATVVQAYERAQSDFFNATHPGSFMTRVSPDAAVRDAANELDIRTSRLFIALSSREDLYRAMLDAAAKQEALAGEDAKLMQDSLRSYKREGMELPKERRAELDRIRQRLSELGQTFARNIQEVNDGIDLTQEQLDGLPAGYIAGLPRTPDGTYRVSLDYPVYLPFMQNATDASARRELFLKFNNRAVENVPVLEEALTLRRQLANLLGYETFAHYAIEERMAKTPERVQGFLDRLAGLLAPGTERDLAELLERKRKDEPGASEVHAWDNAFYSHKLEKERYGVDAEEVRQYFPVDTVVDGTLEVYQELLGLVFRERAPKGAWHPDVRLFEIEDLDGRLIGQFYLDLHPRDGKYKHAAAGSMVQGQENADGTYRKPVSVMFTNFTKPTPDRPSLLTHDEVKTFFHEFGHVMHQTLTTARYPSYSGSSTARDFVEAPSQMLENFVWEPAVLDRLSGHWQDPSRKLPPELREKMIAARDFQVAYFNLKQVGLAAMDMAFHTIAPPLDTTATMRHVWETLGLPKMEPGTHFHAAFGHLMGGYAAGYYGYLWSKVFAQDIYSRFEREGIMSPQVGQAYRRSILERGSSVDEDELLRDFLGREPNEDAFLRSLGLQPAEPAASGK